MSWKMYNPRMLRQLSRVVDRAITKYSTLTTVRLASYKTPMIPPRKSRGYQLVISIARYDHTVIQMW
jgi:hypothetical protein